MSPSKRLAGETTFEQSLNLACGHFTCSACGAEFEFDDINDCREVTPPKYCPICGRSAAVKWPGK